MQPFDGGYSDWFNLEDDWNSYQGVRAVVRQAIVELYKATEMAVSYFTQSVKESQNLSLTHYLVN